MKRLLALTALLTGAALAQTTAPSPSAAPAVPTQTTPTQATPTPATNPASSATSPVTTPPTMVQPYVVQPNAVSTAAPADPYAPKLLSVAELSRKAQVIVRATVGMPLTIKEGEQNWRVYPLDILETLAGDAQSLPKVKYQDKGAVLEKPALWVYADTQEAPNVPSGEAVLFLYSARLDSPLVGYAQGAFVVSNSRVQGLPSGTPGAQGEAQAGAATGAVGLAATLPAPASALPAASTILSGGTAAPATATAQPAATPAPSVAVGGSPAVTAPASRAMSSAATASVATPEKPPLTAQGNPVNTAAINSSQVPAPLTAPAVPLAPPSTDASSPGNTSSASLPPSAPPTSAASAANIVNGDIKPPAPPAPASTPPAVQTPPIPLSAGQLLLEDFRKLVLKSRTGGQS